MSARGDEENQDPNRRRSSRARKQREANPCDFLDEEEDTASTPTSRSASSSDSSGNASSGNDSSNNPSIETRLTRPVVHRRWYWQGKNVQDFSTVDGTDKLKCTYRWARGTELDYSCPALLIKAEKALVAAQDPDDVALEMTNFSSELKLTQVPYHADLLPYYEYFAESVQQHSDLETFSIANFHLPPAPWFGDNILPTLETSSITELVLSNCSLTGEELASLAKFLQGNTTLCSIDLSHNNIESADTVKLIAKAIKKKNSSILHVNLGNCSLGGGGKDALEKLLVAVKKCESLEIGHEDMDSEAVKSIAQFLGRKNALTSFSLVGARLDKENKKAMEQALVKNKTIEELCLRSNGLALPGILRNTKKAMKSLSRLTHLDLSFNSLPVQGAKSLAKFLENSECALTSLILSRNKLTTKGANHILPALKENTSLETLDLSRNWLNDAVAPAVIDLLLNNSTLLSFDLTGNKSLKTSSGGHMYYRGPGMGYETTPRQYRGKAAIVKGALLDATSLEAIASSNHSCAVHLSSQNLAGINEETLRKINELDVSEGVKIRYKVVLAITEVNKDLFDPRSFNDVPLELMPLLLELAQQELGVNGFGKDFLPESKMKKERGRTVWVPSNDPARPWSGSSKYIGDPSLNNIYEIIMGWQSLPLLFVNGAGELPKKKVAKEITKKKSRKRPRKFGDEDDSDDEPYIPKGARKTAKWEYQTVRQVDGSLRRTLVRIPPPVY